MFEKFKAKWAKFSTPEKIAFGVAVFILAMAIKDIVS